MRPDEEDRESGVSPDNGSGSQEDRQLSVAMMFVGVAMIWFAATGFCILANALYWIGAEPRLAPRGLTSPTLRPAPPPTR